MRAHFHSRSLVEHLTALGRYLGCYKMSLECKDALTNFYGRSGYRVDVGNNFMVQRFDEKPSKDAVSRRVKK